MLYNIYCDESCHIENDHKDFLLLGYVRCAYTQVRLHTNYINALKKRHNFFAEIKWSTVSKSKLHFYLELVEYFFATDLFFRVLCVEKSSIDHKKHNKTYDEFYYTMSYILLNHNINSMASYNVYLDIKDTRSAKKVQKLRNILNTRYGVFRHVQNIRSHESIQMQLADFLMGAISYIKNDKEKRNLAKVQIIERIKKLSNETLEGTNNSKKMNVFFIDLK